MREKIISILICPKCGNSLALKIEKRENFRINKGILSCNKCNAEFKITDDIVCFKSILKKGLEEKIKKNKKFLLNQEFYKKWLNQYNRKELSSLKKEWRWMIEKINLINSRIHLDWAVGTGRFLRNILRLTRGDILVLEVDYATCVALKYFLKKIRGYKKVTIVYGDAKNMPFVNNSIDSASSWHGVDEPKMKKALVESKRVLKKSGVLAVSGAFTEKDSKSLKAAIKYEMDLTKKDETYKYFKKLGFKKIDYQIFFEGEWSEKKSFWPKYRDRYSSYGVSGEK